GAACGPPSRPGSRRRRWRGAISTSTGVASAPSRARLAGSAPREDRRPAGAVVTSRRFARRREPSRRWTVAWHVVVRRRVWTGARAPQTTCLLRGSAREGLTYADRPDFAASRGGASAPLRRHRTDRRLS